MFGKFLRSILRMYTRGGTITSVSYYKELLHSIFSLHIILNVRSILLRTFSLELCINVRINKLSR